MPVSPENIRNFFASELRQGATLMKRYPMAVVPALAAIIGVTFPPLVLGATNALGKAIENSPPGVAVRESQQRVAEATATALQTAQDNLRRDFQETGGIDLKREREGFVATPRGSARLAENEGVLINNAWARVRTESGCDVAETIILPEVPGLHSWDAPLAPRTFVIRTNCPVPQA